MQWYEKNEKIKELKKEEQALQKYLKRTQRILKELGLDDEEDYRIYVNSIIRASEKLDDLVELL